LLNVHGINNVRQTEIQTAESSVPKPSVSEVQMAIMKSLEHISQEVLINSSTPDSSRM